MVMAQAAPVMAASSDRHSSERLTARLITAEDGVGSGAGSISAGLEIVLADGWKAYWRSPGEVGLPPRIDWTGSRNVAGAEMLWPAPTRFRAFGIENIGYKHEVVLPIRVDLTEAGAATTLNANVSLLVCADLCVPENFTLSLDLPPGGGVDTAAAERIAAFADRVPEPGAASGITLGKMALTDEAVTLTARAVRPFNDPDVFSEIGENSFFGTPDIRLSEGGRQLWARVPVTALADPPEPVRVTITDGARAGVFTPDLAATAPAPPYAAERAGTSLARLASIALVALLGGAILNLMPCVLPVLSIKLSSAVKARGQSRARLAAGFLAAAGGVVAFMWLLAAGTLAARALGATVGWGLQFQSPAFLALMIVILVAFAANMFGLYEITLPASWQTRMARAEGRAGLAGDVATGAFAAMLATPCSAPFLGTAVAFALSGGTLDVAVIFTALGLGLALPYLLLAARPGLVQALPKPGRWMLVLKGLLGLLLVGTALWLFRVLAGVAGPWAVAAVAVAVALLVLALWPRLPLPATLRAVVLPVLLAGAVVLPGRVVAPPGAATADSAIGWVAFDRGEIARRVSRGEVVFVDVTADWCLTCKANKTLVIDRAPVAPALAGEGVTPMQADWTRPDERIARYLAEHDRYGIPFNIVYGPAAPEGIVLPELLTAGAVTGALAEARGAAAEG